MIEAPFPSWVRVILAAFACYRLAQLVAIDDGPFYVFQRLRTFVGRKASADCLKEDRRACLWYNVAQLVNCPYCLGIWFALALAPAVMWPTIIEDLALLVLGIAGAQCFLEDGDR